MSNFERLAKIGQMELVHLSESTLRTAAIMRQSSSKCLHVSSVLLVSPESREMLSMQNPVSTFWHRNLCTLTRTTSLHYQQTSPCKRSAGGSCCQPASARGKQVGVPIPSPAFLSTQSCLMARDHDVSFPCTAGSQSGCKHAKQIVKTKGCIAAQQVSPPHIMAAAGRVARSLSIN